MINFYFLFLLTFFNIILLFNFKSYSKFFKIEDRPDNIRKIHKKNIKVLGGTLIISNLILYALFYLIFEPLYLEKFYGNKQNFLIFLISSLAMYIIGLLDDKKNLPALNKLTFTIIVISISLFFNRKLITEINLSFYEQKIFLGQFSFLFTLFCYIIFINSFNMLDGINLQAGLYSLFLFLVMLTMGLDIVFSIVILFGIIVYINFNRQNKMFLGDNGCLLLAFIISYCLIDLFNENKIIYSDTILILLMIPGLEIIRLSFERIKNNKSILEADRRHIHHIVKFHNKELKGVLFIQLLIIIPYILSIYSKNYLPIILGSVFIYFFLIYYFKKNDF